MGQLKSGSFYLLGKFLKTFEVRVVAEESMSPNRQTPEEHESVFPIV